MDAFWKIDGAFTLEVLRVSPIPADIAALGTESLRNIWHAAKLGGRSYIPKYLTYSRTGISSMSSFFLVAIDTAPVAAIS